MSSKPLTPFPMHSAHLLEFKPKAWFLLLTDHREEVATGLARFSDYWPAPHTVLGPFPDRELAHEYQLTFSTNRNMTTTTPHGPFIRKDAEAQAQYAGYIAQAQPVPESTLNQLRQQIADVHASAVGEKVEVEPEDDLSPSAFRRRRRP